MKWLEKETAINRKVFRLRCHLYLKVPWIETNDLIMYLLGSKGVCLVSSDKRWLTLSDYLGSDGSLKSDHQDVFVQKQSLYRKWVDKSQILGQYAEDLVKTAFIEEGYSVRQRAVYDYLNPSNEIEAVEIDAECVKAGFHLGVQVKNVISEVFIDPNKIGQKSDIYSRLVKEFEFCSGRSITPVLMAPFIDTSFYCFDDVHKGLHCQTLIQYLRPEDEGLCKNIREVLKFGNLRAVAELPDNVMSWIRRIPEMWQKRHGVMVNRPA